MEKEYYNILVRTPRYTKMLWTMLVVLLVMMGIMMALVNSSIKQDNPNLNPQSRYTQEQFEKRSAEMRTTSQTNLILFVFVSACMFGIAYVKKQTKIITSQSGIEYRNIFKKVYIPWEEVKDVKLRAAGTSMETCIIKGTEGREIRFNAFMLDSSVKYRMEKDNIFDEYDTPISPELKKSKLYKEVTHMNEKRMKAKGGKKKAPERRPMPQA